MRVVHRISNDDLDLNDAGFQAVLEVAAGTLVPTNKLWRLYNAAAGSILGWCLVRVRCVQGWFGHAIS